VETFLVNEWKTALFLVLENSCSRKPPAYVYSCIGSHNCYQSYIFHELMASVLNVLNKVMTQIHVLPLCVVIQLYSTCSLQIVGRIL